jgi:hypothetical protein
MIARISYHTLRRFVLDGVDLDLDAALHMIFVVRRKEVEVLEEAYVEPISANVEMQLMMTINKLQRLEQIDLYHAFVSTNATKAVAGLAYESLGHAMLQEGITLTLTPMIRCQQRKLVHWKSQGEEQMPNSMDVDNNPEITEIFPANTATIYEGS